MAFTPIKQAITNASFKNIRLIATDMDGTLTQHGKFTANLLRAFERLIAVDIPVLIVTGRSAGWVSGLVSYLPVAGAIAENGGLFYPAQFDTRTVYPHPPSPSPIKGEGEQQGEQKPPSSPPLPEGERALGGEGAQGRIQSQVALTPIHDIAAHRQQLA